MKVQVCQIQKMCTKCNLRVSWNFMKICCFVILINDLQRSIIIFFRHEFCFNIYIKILCCNFETLLQCNNNHKTYFFLFEPLLKTTRLLWTFLRILFQNDKQCVVVIIRDANKKCWQLKFNDTQ